MRWYIAKATAEAEAKKAGISVNSYNMMMESIRNMKNGKVSKPVDIDRIRRVFDDLAGCKEHPKYTAKLKPRCSCQKCWDMYNAKKTV